MKTLVDIDYSKSSDEVLKEVKELVALGANVVTCDDFALMEVVKYIESLK